nr:hypothetical protein [Gemmatimonadota bacterium]
LAPTNRDQLGAAGTTFADNKVLQWVAPPPLRKLASLFDTKIRGAAWIDEYGKRLGPTAREFEDHATTLFKNADAKVRAAGGAAMPFNEDEVRSALARLRGDSGHSSFSADDVRNELMTLFDDKAAGAPAMDGLRTQWSNFADRAGRDWRNALGKVDELATNEVNRVGFSFEQTVLDSVVSRVFLFHYWMSRASGLYANEVLKDPKMLANYGRLWDWMETEHEKNGGPDFMKGAIPFFKSPAGHQAMINPMNFLMTMTTFQELGETGKELTGVGEFKEEKLDHFLLMNAMWDGAAYVLGIPGRDAKAPDMSASKGFLDPLQKAFNAFRAEQGLPPVTIDPRDLTNRVAVSVSERMGGALGTQPVAPKDHGAFDQTELRSIMVDVAMRRNPIDDPEMAELIEADLAEDPQTANLIPGTPEHDAAVAEAHRTNSISVMEADILENGEQSEYLLESYKVKSEMDNTGPLQGQVPGVVSGLLRQLMPVPVSSSVDSQQLRMRENKEGIPDDPTADIVNPATGKTMREETNRAVENFVQSPDAEDRAFDLGMDGQYEIGSAGQRWVVTNYNAINNGDVEHNFVANGKTYTPQMMEEMSETARKAVAQDWLDGLGPSARQAQDDWYAEEAAFFQENPQMAAREELGIRAREYPGGPEAFIAAMRQANPNYETYMAEIEKGYPQGSAEYTKAGLYWDGAYQDLHGKPGSVYDAGTTPPEGGFPAIPNAEGVVENVDLAAAFYARKDAEAAARAEEGGGNEEFQASVTDDLNTMNDVRDEVIAAGGDWNQVLEVASMTQEERDARWTYEDGDFPLSYDVSQIMKDRFTGKDGETYSLPGGAALDYYQWAQQQPRSAGISLDDWSASTASERRWEKVAEEEAAAAGTATTAADDPVQRAFGRPAEG